jgi:hypothetical protein
MQSFRIEVKQETIKTPKQAQAPRCATWEHKSKQNYGAKQLGFVGVRLANIEQVKVGFRSKGVEFGEWLVPKTHPLVTYVNEVKIVAKPGQRVLYSKHPTGRTPWDEDLDVVLVFDEQDKLSSRYIGTSHVDWR